MRGTPINHKVQPSAILSADWHLRDTIPICRKREEFLAARDRKMTFICDLQQKYSCPILVAGDVFDQWESSPELLAWAIENAPEQMVCIPGQHDLPEHSLMLYKKSALRVLEVARKCEVLLDPSDKTASVGPLVVRGFPFGSNLTGITNMRGYPKVAMIHTLVSTETNNFMEENVRKIIIEEMPGFDLILSGDNHHSFDVRIGRTLLVNPGPMMRTKADEANLRPRVYLWYAEENRVEPVYLPIEEDVVDRSHIDMPEARDGRMEAYVSRLKGGHVEGISFERNLEAYVKKNGVGEPVKKIIYASMEEKR